MSRALNIDATQEHVLNTCAKHSALVSAIEVLPGGCTRVVLRTGGDAAILRRIYARSVLAAPQKRTPLAPARSSAYVPAPSADTSFRRA